MDDREGAIDVARVKALLFDLGGVVVEIDFRRAVAIWAERAACDPAVLGGRFVMDRAYEDHERGILHLDGYLNELRSALEVDLSDADLLAGWNAIFLEPVAGMPALLAAAAERFPLFAFTNSNPTHQEVWEAKFAEHLRVFQSVFVSSELGLRKPDPEAFEAVLCQMGAAPEEVLFFDDTLSNIDGARAAGLQAIHFTSVEDAGRPLRQLGVGALLEP